MDKKEQILDLYFNKHLKQKQIAETLNCTQQYVSKIIKKDERYQTEKTLGNLLMLKNEKYFKQNIKKVI